MAYRDWGNSREVTDHRLHSGRMPTRLTVDLRTCAAIQAEGVLLRPALAEVSVAAQCSRTGRLRRVLITEAIGSISPDELARGCAHSPEDTARLPWSFNPAEGLLTPWAVPGWPQVRLRSQQQRRGVRWLYLCPACNRPTRRIYAVHTREEDVTGCRRCLGLVYPSQSRHRTLRGDEAVLHGRYVASPAALQRAQARDERRFTKVYGKFAGFLGHPLEFFADAEAVHATYGKVWEGMPSDTLS